MPIPQTPSPLANIVLTRTYNASWGSGSTFEAKIQDMINKALLDGATIANPIYVLVPATFFPYNPTLVTFSPAVPMLAEGGGFKPWDAMAYGGKQASGSVALTIKYAIANAAAAGGGRVDCENIPNPAILDSDIFSALAIYEKNPITLSFGPQTVRLAAVQKPRSNTTIVLNGTKFLSVNAAGSPFTVNVDTINGFEIMGSAQELNVLVQTTAAGSVLVKADPTNLNWNALEIGSPIAILGKKPYLGTDRTLLNGGIGSGDSSITVDSTTGFPSTGSDGSNFIVIDNELIQYTSVDATHFLGCSRGYGGTTAASHLDNAPVERVGYTPFIVDTINTSTNQVGLNVTLDEVAVMPMNATVMPAVIGAYNVRFEGIGIIDGSMTTALQNSTDDVRNPQGIRGRWSRSVYVGPGIEIVGWDHGGVSLEAVQDCIVTPSKLERIGNLVSNIGAGVWLFGACKRNYVHIPWAVQCESVVSVDDRSTNGQIVDGPGDQNVVVVDRCTQVRRGIIMSGGQRNNMIVKQVSQGLANVVGMVWDATQWIINVAGSDNYGEIGTVDDPGFTWQHFNAASTLYDNSTFNQVVITDSLPVVVCRTGISLQTPDALNSLTYGTTITPAPERSVAQTVTITNGTAFTIANPAVTSRARGRRFSIRFHNASGGAHGTGTFGGDYRLIGGGATLPAIANGQNRTFEFEWDGTVWKGISATPSDVPN